MTQAQRHDAGKAEMHYLHTWYHALQEVCRVCTTGAKKYTRGNYLLGQPYSELLNAAERHVFKFGHPNLSDGDIESKCHNLAHAIWNLLQLLELEMTDETQWDDRIVPPDRATPKPGQIIWEADNPGSYPALSQEEDSV